MRDIIKKNIISNNCTSGFIYKDLSCTYMNPFIWSTFTYYNFNLLMDCYDSLNFTDFSIEESLLTKAYKTNRWKDTLSVLIDNRQLCVNYIHYHQDNTKLKIEKKGVDLYYYDIKNHLHEVFTRRVRRMVENGLNEPIFILNKTIFYTNDEFYNIAYKPTKYKKIVCFPFNFKVDESRIPENTHTVILPQEVDVEPKYARYLIDKYPELIEIKKE